MPFDGNTSDHYQPMQVPPPVAFPTLLVFCLFFSVVAACVAVASYFFLVGFFLTNGIPPFQEAGGLLLAVLDQLMDSGLSIPEASARHGLHTGAVPYPLLGMAAGMLAGTVTGGGLACFFERLPILRKILRIL